MRALALLALALLSAPTLATAPGPMTPGDATGTWRGFITRQDTGTRHVVTLTLKDNAVPGKVIGGIDYPGLGCGGQLIAVTTQDRTLVVREKLRYGLDRCAPDTLLYLTPGDPNTLDYAVYTPRTTLKDAPTEADINGRGVLKRAR
ncbi:hypothetical protein [Deinococcus maricopensis]|uniref:DUF306 domain-containing protein n=1 Tax=Deinococcus maricopensis (strain DSM 21211 / LMG 22137 / NRRL B-23946 / LB-34) TaxID=709986 RepID=E8U4M2_DEIML|nr:hypothetical protein [Deinococcus maricopensis]ADV68887.1 hypothetical protein Deima_3260 [Deinococcus maricopensis DSM 21211]